MTADTSLLDPAPRATAGPGLILFAHGARDPRWAAPFEAVAKRIRSSSPQTQVRLAFLEFMKPDLVSAGLELAAIGCSTVAILPMFLGAGGHVRKDLPLLMDDLRAQASQVDWQLRPAIGEAPDVIDAMARHAVGDITRAPSP
jgi:sirohydrochlorin cobaltochelatase